MFRSRQTFRRGLAATVVAAVVLIGATAAGALWNSFGDSSFAIGTPLDEAGARTVCHDGFDVLLAWTPNDSGPPYSPVVGGPTGETPGSVEDGPLVGVFGAALVDDYDFDNDLTTADTPGPEGAFIYIDIATGQPAASLYGFAQTEYVNQEFFTAEDGIFKAVGGTGSVPFTPTADLPIGEDLVIVTRSYIGFGSHRRVTVVDCSEPTEVDVELLGNKVHADKPSKKIKAYVVNDGSFDIAAVDDVMIGEAEPFKVKLTDMDDDGDLDLKVTAYTGDTGVACGDTELTVTGTVDGEPFETTLDITTKCKKNKHGS